MAIASAARQFFAVAQRNDKFPTVAGLQFPDAADVHDKRAMNPDESGAVELFSHFADWLAEQMRVRSGEVEPYVICVSLDPIDLIYWNKDHAAPRLDNQPIVRLIAVFRKISAHYVAHPHLFRYSQFSFPLGLLLPLQAIGSDKKWFAAISTL